MIGWHQNELLPVSATLVYDVVAHVDTPACRVGQRRVDVRLVYGEPSAEAVVDRCVGQPSGLGWPLAHAGLMFWFPRKTFVASHSPLMPARRVYFASP